MVAMSLPCLYWLKMKVPLCAGAKGAQKKTFPPKVDGSHEQLDEIEATLERLSKDLKIMTKHKSHIKLEVSASNVMGRLDKIPLSIDVALLPVDKNDPIKCSINKTSSSRLANPHRNSKKHHFDKRHKTALLLDKMRLSSLDLNCMSQMAHNYLLVLQKKAEPLSVEQLCSVGHDLFAMRDWKGAMDMYSGCIPILLDEIESSKEQDKKEGNLREKQVEDLLLLTYSNQAETYLQLGNYEAALTNTTKALDLNAKHRLSLVRKGRALEGLEQYEQSLACYMLALHEEPQDEDTRKALIQCQVCYEQAHKGVYDLTKFILSGSEGDLPLCRDFVGPVEIQMSPLGGRGLFATRDLAIGELVLVNSALLVAPKDSMVRELWSLVSSSKQRMQQVSTLSSNLNKDMEENMEVPPMDLFTPGSYHNLKRTTFLCDLPTPLSEKDLCQSQEIVDQQANLEHIARIVEVNAVNVMDVIASAEPGNDIDTSSSVYSGLWLLPSLINHSCTPNCVTSTPAGIAFVRVSKQVKSGEELNIAYFDVMKNLEMRTNLSEQCHFACKCPRCVWEWSYPKELQSAREKLLILANKAIIDCMKCASPISRLRVLPHLASLILSFETIIQSLDLELNYQNWIRASIMDTYLATSRVLMAARMYVEPTNRIQMLNLLVEAIKAGGGGDGEVMGIGVMLLNQVEWHHGKESNEFLKTEAMLRNVFKIFHGNLTRDVFQALVSSYSKLLDNIENKDLVEGMGDLYEALVQLQDTLTKSIGQFHHLQNWMDASANGDEIITQDCNDDEVSDEESILEFLSKIKQ